MPCENHQQRDLFDVGDSKKCIACGQLKSREEYYPIRGRAGTSKVKRAKICKTCYSGQVAEQKRLKYETDPEYRRRYKEKQKVRNREIVLAQYGMTRADWERMLAEQNGGCAICGRTYGHIRDKQEAQLAIDHCHRTDEVRSLLCMGCNRLVGKVEAMFCWTCDKFVGRPETWGEKWRRGLAYILVHRERIQAKLQGGADPTNLSCVI